MTDAIVKNPKGVKSADIVVGIPSLDEADSIAVPTEAAGRGLSEFFPGLRAAIINVDNCSTDGTPEAFFSTPTSSPKIYVSTPAGVRGKGNNLRNLFRAAVDLGARAVVMVDADLTTITPSWIRYLAEPVLDGFDYVSPIYVRHKYDGTITNHIAYPMLRSLCGLRVRQPIGGDFGFSGKFARALLSERHWDEHTAHFGIDIWMTTIAIARKFEVCQAFLGSPKGHKPKDPAADLGPMFTQVVCTLFALMNEFEYVWKEVRDSRPSSVFGFGLGVSAEVPEVEIDTGSLFDSLRSGIEEHREILREILSDSVADAVGSWRRFDSEPEVSFGTDLWARILFDFAVAHRNGTVPVERLVEALIPLYHARILAYYNRTHEMDTRDAEEYLENISRTFEAEKPYLVERWNSTASADHERLLA